MSNKKFTKADEIKLLMKLRDSESYLVEYLGEEGINSMIRNIENDYPIELNVFTKMGEIENRINHIKASLDDYITLSEQSAQDLSNFKNKILKSLLPIDNGDVRSIINNNFKSNQIIISKLTLGIELDRHEIMLMEELFNKQ